MFTTRAFCSALSSQAFRSASFQSQARGCSNDLRNINPKILRIFTKYKSVLTKIDESSSEKIHYQIKRSDKKDELLLVEVDQSLSRAF